MDNDCDGVLTGDDCDDSDNTDAALSGDCDQDGVVTADDCDDTDTAFGDIAYDADCDGVIDPVCGGGLEPEQDSALCYIDVDEDGYGDETIVAGHCPRMLLLRSKVNRGVFIIRYARIIGYEDGTIELWLGTITMLALQIGKNTSTTYCPDPRNLVELEFFNGYGIAQYEPTMTGERNRVHHLVPFDG